VSKSNSAKKKAGKPTSKPQAKSSSKSKPAASAKKPAAKPASKSSAKPSAKPASKPTASTSKKPAAPAASSKPAAAANAKKPAPAVAAPAPAPAPVAGALGDRPKPKGITIVNNKPMRKPKPPKKAVEMPSLGAPLLGGNKKWKPLIPSGPNAKAEGPVFHAGSDELPKSPFNKKELERYRDILLKKRSELVGDVANLEGEALNASSGSLSHTPQHLAEQGTESFDQALSLDIAQVDRNLIREIDDALKRIKDGTFGICLLTHKPISKDRLEELPWTRYSIEAARERERREFIRP
jgi:RNA polymerase-binding transcription factor DksA